MAESNDRIDSASTYSPMRTWRLALGISQELLAHRARVSTATVAHNEWLLYTDPSPKIIQYFRDNLEMRPLPSWEWFESHYHNAQLSHREYTDTAIGGFEQGLIEQHPFRERHPFTMWRESLGFETRLALCRGLCVSSSQVLNYEMARQRRMPKQIRQALKPFLGTKLLQTLDKAGIAYYDSRSF